jgi:hypothetical protein
MPHAYKDRVAKVRWASLTLFTGLHFALSVVCIVMPIGCVAESMIPGLSRYESPYFPGISLVGVLLGFYLAPRLHARSALWTWVCGLLWLLCGVFDTWRVWSLGWSQQTHWRYVWNNLFGTANLCSGSECLSEFIFTAPFLASIFYSLGAGANFLIYRRSPGYKRIA